MSLKHKRFGKRQRGFTLVEALFSAVLLALLAAGTSALYVGGLNSLDVHNDHAACYSTLRSYMEKIIGSDYSSLTSSTTEIQVNGQTCTMTQDVALVDITGDLVNDPGVLKITLTLSGGMDGSLSTLIVDSSGRVAKL